MKNITTADAAILVDAVILKLSDGLNDAGFLSALEVMSERALTAHAEAYRDGKRPADIAARKRAIDARFAEMLRTPSAEREARLAALDRDDDAVDAIAAVKAALDAVKRPSAEAHIQELGETLVQGPTVDGRNQAARGREVARAFLALPNHRRIRIIGPELGLVTAGDTMALNDRELASLAFRMAADRGLVEKLRELVLAEKASLDGVTA